MAYSQIGVLNLGLDKIGEASISALSVPGDPKSYTAAAIWEYIRDEVLATLDWSFAKVEAELVRETSYTSLGKWDYRYTMPSACLRIRKVRDENGNSIPYEEMGDYIYCDYDNTDSPIYMDYTTIITDVAKWSAHFINSISCRLAAEFALKLAKTPTLQEKMMNFYKMALSDAIGVNQSRGYVEDESSPDSWIKAGR